MQNRKEQLRQQRERELRQVALSERNATIGCGDLAAVGGHCEAYIPWSVNTRSLGFVQRLTVHV